MHEVVDISSSSGLPDEATRVVLRSVVRAVLDLAGYESGSAHTDVVLTAHGPRISALRLAGSRRRGDE